MEELSFQIIRIQQRSSDLTLHNAAQYSSSLHTFLLTVFSISH